MKQKEIDEIITCMPKGRTKFYYFKDKYPFMLLSYFINDKISIGELKKSQFKKLINKPIVKDYLAKLGKKYITKSSINSYWQINPNQECFLLTLGSWGNEGRWGYRGYNQTSRVGKNLVLQLNFSQKHNRQYYKLIKPI